MVTPRGKHLLLIAGLIASAACGSAQKMSFFVTSVRTGDGGNLGGVAGADAHCQALAAKAGSRRSDWRAYLSAEATASSPKVNARDRIGNGPWFNANGTRIAADLDDLHSANKLGGRTSVDENGNLIGAGVHDILTGSNPDGTLAEGDATCHGWTSADGHAMVGHSNKIGSIGGDRAKSWNSAHLSEGCSMPALQKLGSGGLLYCFAKD